MGSLTEAAVSRTDLELSQIPRRSGRPLGPGDGRRHDVPHSHDHGHDHSQNQDRVDDYEAAAAAHGAHELKPVDRGRDAWQVLIAGFVLDGLFWGFPMCFGVFQDYYSRLPEFTHAGADIPTIGVLSQSLWYLGAPFSAALTRRLPKYQRHQICLGWLLAVLGLLSASFARSVGGLIGTQGFLYGLGFSLLSMPIMSMLNEWWVAKKGMAFGLIAASSGVTGSVLPFLLDWLLRRHGHRTALRACAAAMTLLSLPLLPLFRNRLPPSEQAVLARPDWRFLRAPLFWIYSSAVLVQGMGFYYPLVFLPSYASSVGVPSLQGALLVSLMSIFQVLGQFAFGWLSDKNISPSLLACVCALTAAAASFTFWGLAKSLAFLVVFSLLYGFFAFGFGTMRVAMGRAVSDDPSTVFAIYPILVFLQGVGNILTGPLSSVLIASKQPVREQYAAGRYDAVVIMTGATSCGAALIMMLWHGQRLKQICT
ncbi:Monocarboxylate transporter 13 [Escovopsis weberi]|uniref:Monocarboxylate transporter 13 n=1 Tax=Escovopsis weberi TaxID=150374 RepID=A0A0M9VWL4_ESCWE|nr:Monocarboxylate transporter 13 [Escovopsis weberi]